MRHTFAICAYGDSPYLEECIRSLQRQSRASDLILCTASPSPYIRKVAGRYGLPLFVNTGTTGIAGDWNFAYKKAKTDLVTIAHQDDVYHRDYTKTLLRAKALYPDMSVFMTASRTVKGELPVRDGGIEHIKRLLRLPLRLFALNHLPFVKRLALSFGNPVICPSCCYDKSLCGEDIFPEGFHFVLDWMTLLRLAKDRYRWICVEKPLIRYRVHDLSATKACIDTERRLKEEQAVFAALWGKTIAKLILFFYKGAYRAYQSEE